MKGRVVFPIHNIKGEIAAYAGRAVKPEDEKENGKYRFPPKFNKSLELFNIDRIAADAETKKAVKDFGIILVEGFTDAMKLCQEGFPNVVALMGTDFHEAQKNMLLDPQLNPTRRITLFLDNDEAGQNGKRHIAAECIHDGFIRYIDWPRAPEGKSEPEHFVKDELVAMLGLGK
jgi:DNA primase